MTDTTTPTVSPEAELDALDRVLTATGDLLAGVRPEQLHDPTPCPDYDVSALVGHVVAWVRVFASGLAEGEPVEQPDVFVADDPAAEFRAATAQALDGVRRLGLDREVHLTSGGVPARSALRMMIGEYVAHGWDLATATGQPVPYTDDVADLAADGMAPMLLDEYRGPGMPFAHAVPVGDDARPLVRFLCFTGRDAR
ncbi:uncharacterized protein (TIGR03086 family) [Motilibacter peucedani]|uniref:Uncharacterized protein (TIGR03086 family) n=1 Tax=Motilibacter peucedani TaxID=598650 RepID=A0A420XMW6_9ACTN|nr:TIGR03086 family metal-binding protein [Motilibacter peucedani]RKS72618.1 uncharacterized protein (TIGR03086 family) [Motilibacter peucedani]